MPLIVGRMYVEKYFNVETKEKVSDFADNIKKSFVEILNEQQWMDNETKKRALNKATKMTDKYGFPVCYLIYWQYNDRYT